MQISALHLYPIKGCRGSAVTSVDVDGLGPVGDRRLMLVDARGRFISQRECPALATIVPTLDGDALSVAAPGLAALRIVIDRDAEPRAVHVWGSQPILAADQGGEAAEWFSDIIGTPCRLVAFGPAARNPVDPQYAPRIDAETAFTDGYPIMATLEESLADLNRRLAEPIPMARFRPGVVVAGAAAWSEDDWMAMKLGPLDCDAVKPCGRCVVTTTDQVTGAKHSQQEPLRTLASFRTLPGIGAIFGQNIVPRSSGTLRVGDVVELM